MKGSSTFRIVITALFAALICVFTMLIQIPISATGGYANLGDGVILICAFMMPPFYSVLAAALGSFLADILAGYVSYAFGTLIIKGCVALIASLLMSRIRIAKGMGRKVIALAFSGILAEAFMILGYFVYEAAFLGLGLSAAGAIAGNLGQGIVGVIVSCVATPILLRSHEITEMMNRL